MNDLNLRWTSDFNKPQGSLVVAALKNKVSQPYPKTYDLYYQGGLTVNQMRVDEVANSSGTRGLKLYSVMEPELYGKLCERIAGIHATVQSSTLGDDRHVETNQEAAEKFKKPPKMTWRQYLDFLFKTMPQRNAEHYKSKFAVAIHWANVRGFIFENDPENYGIPDEDPNDIRGSGNVLTWRKMCYSVVNADFWCRWLSFSPMSASQAFGYTKLMMRRRLYWGIFPPHDKLLHAVFPDEAEFQHIKDHPGDGLMALGVNPDAGDGPGMGSKNLHNIRKTRDQIQLPEAWKGTLRETDFNTFN